MLDDGGFRNSFGGDKIVICQICFIPRHSAYKCINMFNHAFIPRQGRGNQVVLDLEVANSMEEALEEVSMVAFLD